MNNTVSMILDYMNGQEKTLAQKIRIANYKKVPETKASRLLKLCFLCFMVSPYLKGKTSLGKLIQLCLCGAAFYDEKFFDYHQIKGASAPEIEKIKVNIEQLQLPEEVKVFLSEATFEAVTLKSGASKLARVLVHWLSRYMEFCKPSFKKSKIDKEFCLEPLIEKVNEPFVVDIYNALFNGVSKQKKDVLPFTESLLDFLMVVDDLCQIERDNLKSTGGKETDALHIAKMLWWAMLISPLLKKSVDAEHIYPMILAHDVVEARCGDIPLALLYNNAALKLEKIQSEWEAIRYFRATLPAPFNNALYNAFDEYETKETFEAKVVWALDKLDANWQANLYNNGDVRYWGEYENGYVYYMVATTHKPQIAKMEEPILSELENRIIKIAQENMQKCGIKAA